MADDRAARRACSVLPAVPAPTPASNAKPRHRGPPQQERGGFRRRGQIERGLKPDVVLYYEILRPRDQGPLRRARAVVDEDELARDLVDPMGHSKGALRLIRKIRDAQEGDVLVAGRQGQVGAEVELLERSARVHRPRAALVQDGRRHEAIPPGDVAAQVQGGGPGSPIPKEEREAIEHAAWRGERLTVRGRVRSAELDDGSGIAAGGVDGGGARRSARAQRECECGRERPERPLHAALLAREPRRAGGGPPGPPPSDASSWCA